MIIKYCCPTGDPDNDGSSVSPWDLRTLMAWVNEKAILSHQVLKVTSSGASLGQTFDLDIDYGSDDIVIDAGDTPAVIQAAIDARVSTYAGWASVIVVGEALYVNDGPLYFMNKGGPALTVTDNGIAGFVSSYEGSTEDCVGAIRGGQGDYDISAEETLHILGGNLETNQPARLIGYKDSISLVDGYPVSDLDEGQTYYKSVRERQVLIQSGHAALQTAGYPTIDFQGGIFADGGFDLRWTDYIVMQNIQFANCGSNVFFADEAVLGDPNYTSDFCQHLFVKNCIFTNDAVAVFGGSAKSLTFLNCNRRADGLGAFVNNRYNLGVSMVRNTISEQLANGTHFKGQGTVVLDGCLVIGGNKIIQTTYSPIRVITNCTLVNQLQMSVYAWRETNTVFRNNIVRLDDSEVDMLAVFCGDDNSTLDCGGVLFEENNIYDIGSIPWSDFSPDPAASEPVMNATSKLTTVTFADESNYDYAPTDRQLRVNGRWVGAVQPPYSKETVFLQS